jgi:hypothetical protein
MKKKIIAYKFCSATKTYAQIKKYKSDKFYVGFLTNSNIINRNRYNNMNK